MMKIDAAHLAETVYCGAEPQVEISGRQPKQERKAISKAPPG